MRQIIIFDSKNSPMFRSSLHDAIMGLMGEGWRSGLLLEEGQDLSVVVISFHFALAPDSFKFSILDPADLNDSCGSSCRMALDVHFVAIVLGNIVL